MKQYKYMYIHIIHTRHILPPSKIDLGQRTRIPNGYARQQRTKAVAGGCKRVIVGVPRRGSASACFGCGQMGSTLMGLLQK